ncbi:RES family NAD+ phosphorylase [Thalassospira sp.]|uniref:RES family NAD+ phosphorylase n=1 Tax=Thalassospira sp. TaxID=1912094 RepID=UPI002732713F|nr:RES family NAD+ phosphorylase [Thalassospira sp.]MDP2699741.1 RES family NAD+ phosphorylase [Thalassospira sp.]
MSAFDLDDVKGTTAPDRTHRIIPSRFPPLDAFDMAETAEDARAILELESWTNDRLSESRLKRLPAEELVFGRPNASVVLAAFLHSSPNGLRFSSPYLGAWYASSTIQTAMTEVTNGLRRELSLSELESITQEYREYTAKLDGNFVDIRDDHDDLHNPDVACYPTTQTFGEAVRASDWHGIAYRSVRDPDGENWVSYRPSQVNNVLQARHFRVKLGREGKVFVEEL